MTFGLWLPVLAWMWVWGKGVMRSVPVVRGLGIPGLVGSSKVAARLLCLLGG